MNLISAARPDPGPADEALVCAVQRGDKKALSALILRYRPLAEKTAASYTGVSLEKDDFIQEALLALLSAAYTYTAGGKASFRTYASVCMQNRLRSVLRAEAAEKNAPLNTYIPLDELSLPGGDDPEDRLIYEEERQTLFRHFERDLSSLEKQVLICRIEGLGYSEIAKKLHITEKSADNALQRVRGKLKKLYE